MTKEFRKELLERMIKANDEFAADKDIHAYRYAACLIELCSQLEYKHAKAIREYDLASENAARCNELWDGNMNTEEYNIMENLNYEASNLYGPCLDGLKYFLGIDNDATIFEIPKT